MFTIHMAIISFSQSKPSMLVLLLLISFVSQEIFADDGIHRVQDSNFSSFDGRKGRSSICFDNLGCFDSETGPLAHVGLLPWKPEDIDTKVYLFTPSNRHQGEIIDWLDPEPLLQSAFDPNLRTVFFSHGFNSAGNISFVHKIKNAFFAAEPVNFLSLDWNKGASTAINYPAAVANSELVGRQEANLIAMILDTTGLDPAKLHVTGYSLGAQIPNFCANFLRELKPGFRIPRITAFDPASPYFYDDDSYSADTHLDKSDADYVDVIHTNGGNLVTGHLSTLEAVGHVDFYVNGGSDQPGCPNSVIGNIEEILGGEDVETECNHKRSWQTFVESLVIPDEECSYIAFPCPDLDDFGEDFLDGGCFTCHDDGEDEQRKCGKLGFYSDRNPGRGKQYLRAHSEQDSPDSFCGVMYKVSVKSSHYQESGSTSTFGQLEISLIKRDEDGVSETTLGPYRVYRKDDMELQTGKTKSGVILALKPAIRLADVGSTLRAQIRYVPFDGFLVDGDSRWNVDEIVVTDAFGVSMLYSSFETTLEAGVPLDVVLSKQ